MISKEIATQVLEKCLITGGDFAEIFEEDSITNSISVLDDKVENILGGRDYGIGIRIFKNLKSVYAYTNDNSLSSLLDTAYKAAIALGKIEDGKSIVLNNQKTMIGELGGNNFYLSNDNLSPEELSEDRKSVV